MRTFTHLYFCGRTMRGANGVSIDARVSG